MFFQTLCSGLLAGSVGNPGLKSCGQSSGQNYGFNFQFEPCVGRCLANPSQKHCFDQRLPRAKLNWEGPKWERTLHSPHTMNGMEICFTVTISKKIHVPKKMHDPCSSRSGNARVPKTRATLSHTDSDARACKLLHLQQRLPTGLPWAGLDFDFL